MLAGVWLHGEAVAAGMVMAADMSHRLGWIDQSILDRTRRLLQRAHLPVEPPQVNGSFLNLHENLWSLFVHISVSCYLHQDQPSTQLRLCHLQVACLKALLG